MENVLALYLWFLKVKKEKREVNIQILLPFFFFPVI